MTKRLFIIQNTELASGRALSVFLTGLLSNLAKDGQLEINLIVSRSEHIPEKIRSLCDSIHEIDASLYSARDNLLFSWRAAKLLRGAHREKPIDVIHSLYPNSSLLAAVLFIIFAKDKPKLIYDVRSPWIEMIFARQHLKTRFMKLIKSFLFAQERWLARWVDHFVFITMGLRSYYQGSLGYTNQPYSIIPTAVDAQVFQVEGSDRRMELGLDHNARIIGYVGTIDFSRQLKDFLTSFISLAKERRQFHLVFIGEGNARPELEQISKQNHAVDQVHFLGRIPHDEVPAYIRSFDYGLCHLPAGFIYDHSFPLKVLEYLACGVPVLASDLEAHQQIAQELNGLNLYNNTEDLVAILQQPSEKPANPAISKFTWPEVAKRYFDLYLQL